MSSGPVCTACSLPTANPVHLVKSPGPVPVDPVPVKNGPVAPAPFEAPAPPLLPSPLPEQAPVNPATITRQSAAVRARDRKDIAMSTKDESSVRARCPVFQATTAADPGRRLRLVGA